MESTDSEPQTLYRCDTKRAAAEVRLGDGEVLHGTRAQVTVLPRVLPFIMPEGPLLLPAEGE